jgi:hypothetical protein
MKPLVVNTLLDYQQYAAVLGSLVSDKGKSQERRRDPRVGVRLKLRLIVLPASQPQPDPNDLWLRDISVGGLGLACRRPLDLNANFLLVLGRGPQPPALLAFRVTNSRQVSPDLYSVGAVALAAGELDAIKLQLSASNAALVKQLVVPAEVIAAKAA